MSGNAKPYFAPQPKQFPQRAGQTHTTTDPQYQLICPCGGELFDQAVTLYRVPGQIIGTFDLTFAQCVVCRECGEPLNVKDTRTRQELEKEKLKEGA